MAGPTVRRSDGADEDTNPVGVREQGMVRLPSSGSATMGLMELRPRYDRTPAIDLRVDPESIRQPMLTQRRRLIDLVASLDDGQLAAPSRCEAWSVAGVLAHLVDVDRFWAVSATSGAAGSPTRFLEHFDPEATPRAMVDDWAGVSPADTRARLVDATTALCDLVDGLDGEWWTATAESPAGHVTLDAMLAHALWDGWTHERDVRIPLGLDPVEDDAELTACLVYVSTLSPALAVSYDPDRLGQLDLIATEPEACLNVDIDDGVAAVSHGEPRPDVPRLTGRAVEVMEGMTQRIPLTHDLDPDDAWLVDGLAEVFRPVS